MTALQGPAGRTRHWDRVYRRLDETQVSWFESDPTCSMALLNALGVGPDLSVVDIGAGASHLIDTLLARGFRDLTALDVSDEGLTQTRKRLGCDATQVHWVVTDALTWHPGRRFDVWHDRAVFHFLTDPTDQARYLSLLTQALTAQGQVIIGTFAEDGPPQCSGLPVARYSLDELSSALGDQFEVMRTHREEHKTPSNAVQPFTWLAARRRQANGPS